MRIEEIMSTNVITIKDEESTKTAVDIMEKKNIHHLVVNNKQGQLTGVISMQDIRLIGNFGSSQTGEAEDVDWKPIVIDDVKVKHLMSVPVITLESDSKIKAAAKIMLENSVHCIPVTKAGKVGGIITDKDLLAAIADGRVGGD